MSKIKPSHQNICRLIAVLQNVQLKTDSEKVITINSGALLEPLQGGELSYHLFKYGALSQPTARAFLI